MSTTTEYEAKVLDIDPDLVVGRIKLVGGVHVADRLMRRYVYDVVPGTSGPAWRVLLTLATSRFVERPHLGQPHENEHEHRMGLLIARRERHSS